MPLYPVSPPGFRIQDVMVGESCAASGQDSKSASAESGRIRNRVGTWDVPSAKGFDRYRSGCAFRRRVVGLAAVVVACVHVALVSPAPLLPHVGIVAQVGAIEGVLPFQLQT